MDKLSLLESVPVQRTRLGIEYIVLVEVPTPLREQCWAHLGRLRAQLIVDGTGPSALIQVRQQWIESLPR